MIDKINAAIRCVHMNIVNDEEHGLRYQAVEKLDELLVAVARIALSDNFALRDLQSREKRGGAVACGHRHLCA